MLVATGDRWHAAASILAAKAGKDVYSEKPCGITIADCQQLADTMHREQRVFQAGTQRRSVPNFQKAVELAHTGKLGKLHTLHASVYMPTLDNTWLPGRAAARRASRRLESVARPGGVAAVQSAVCRRRLARPVGLRLRGHGCSIGAPTRSTSASGPTRPTTRMPIEYEPTDDEHRLPLRQRREADPRLPAANRSATATRTTSRGSAPARCGSWATKVRSRPATKGKSSLDAEALQKELPRNRTKRVRGLDVGGPRAELLRLHPSRGSRRPPIPK